CVEFACSPRVHKGFPPLRIPTEKQKEKQKEQNTPVVPDRDGRFTWSPGAEKLPTAPGGSWRRDDSGWVKGRSRIHATSGLCVCVCGCVCVCVCVCVVRRAQQPPFLGRPRPCALYVRQL